MKFIRSSIFINLCATVILTVCGAFVSNYEFPVLESGTILKIVFNPYLWGIISIALYILSGLKTHKNNEKLEKLESENKHLSSTNSELRSKLNSCQEELSVLKSSFDNEKRNKVKDWLKGLYKQIKLTTYDRISIYSVINGEEFHLISRYSSNPELSKSNTKSYILDKGVLYKAWCHKKHYDNQCPEFFQEKENEYYEYISKTYNYELDELHTMKMKSCRYFGLAIEDKNENIGVILFESLKPDNINEELLDDIEDYCDNYHDYLCGFIREYILDINSEKDKKESMKDKNPDQDILNTLGRKVDYEQN